MTVGRCRCEMEAASPEPQACQGPVALQDYLDAVFTDKAYTVFERAMSPLVQLLMRRRFPELPRGADGTSEDCYVAEFEAKQAEHAAEITKQRGAMDRWIAVLNELKLKSKKLADELKDEEKSSQLWKHIFGSEGDSEQVVVCFCPVPD